jgi:hypothetical protein
MRKPRNRSDTRHLPSGSITWPAGILAVNTIDNRQIVDAPAFAALTDHLIITPQFNNHTLVFTGATFFNAGVIEYWIVIYNADPAVAWNHGDLQINWLAIPQ